MPEEKSENSTYIGPVSIGAMVMGNKVGSSSALTPRGGISTPTQPSEMTRENALLSVRLEVLEQRIVDLHQKLKPVLRQSEENEVSERNKEENPQTEIGKTIRSHRERIERSIDAVVYITKLLEV